jgi:hypothetical protein
MKVMAKNYLPRLLRFERNISTSNPKANPGIEED